MKKYLKHILLVVFCPLLFLSLHAEKKDSIVVNKSNFTVGLNYLSNKLYMGRIDSANIKCLTPSIGFYHKSGLHVGASMSYQLDRGLSKIDEIKIDGGYDFNLNDNLNGGLTVEKYFFNAKSSALNSGNSFGAGSNLSYDLDIVTLNVGADLALGSYTDIFINAGFSHSFEFDKFSVEPSFLFNAGTLNFYNAYLIAGKSHKTGKGKKKATTITYSIEDASRFKILDYEISVPVSYSFHNFKFDLIPTYYIPVSPATIISTVSSNKTTVEEVISNHFIIELGVSYEF